LTSVFEKILVTENLTLSSQTKLQLSIVKYHNNVSQLMNKVVEIELLTANNTLQFQRILPNIKKNQLKINELINSIATKLGEQLRVSKSQTIIIFSSAFVILAFFMFFQIRSAQFLVQRLRQLTDCMFHIRSGDFSGASHLTQSNDEIGILANNFQKMTTQIQSQIAIIKQEKEKSDALLLNILPLPIAIRLKQKEELIADKFENATVLFCDIVNFTNLSVSITPEELVKNLNTIFTLFDELTTSYNLEKIKTIGDAYMIVGGVPNPCDDHAEQVANAAIKMIEVMSILSNKMELPFSIRIGIHSGAVVAGVIGVTKFAYDLWGDTVNTASRMESHGMPGKIHCSEAVYELLKDKFCFEARGIIKVKGKGEMFTYFLQEKINAIKLSKANTSIPLS